MDCRAAEKLSRRGELLGLSWGRVDFQNQQIVVTGTKGRRGRVQPINEQAVVLLRELQASTLKDGGPFRGVNENMLPRLFSRIVEAAGIEPCVVHDLRRTFVTDLARLGVNQVVVKELAGHASSATTEKYHLWVSQDTKRDAVRRLSEAG